MRLENDFSIKDSWTIITVELVVHFVGTFKEVIIPGFLILLSYC